MAAPQPSPPAPVGDTPPAAPPAQLKVFWEWHGAFFSLRCAESTTPGLKDIQFLSPSAEQLERRRRLREGLRTWWSRGVTSLLVVLPLAFIAFGLAKDFPWYGAALMASPGFVLAVWVNLVTGNLGPPAGRVPIREGEDPPEPVLAARPEPRPPESGHYPPAGQGPQREVSVRTAAGPTTWLGWFLFWLGIAGTVLGIGAAVAYLGFAFTGRFDDSLRFGLGGALILIGGPAVLACICQRLSRRP